MAIFPYPAALLGRQLESFLDVVEVVPAVAHIRLDDATLVPFVPGVHRQVVVYRAGRLVLHVVERHGHRGGELALGVILEVTDV